MKRLEGELKNKLSAGSAWVGGQIIPISEAVIPVNDWGLTHSDITYDVAPVRNGHFFRLDDYLNRFEDSMKAMRLANKRVSFGRRSIYLKFRRRHYANCKS